MTSGVEQQKKAFEQALQQIYTACIFDIDGTLTVHGDEYIPVFLQPKLAELSMNVPMAVCTGRRLQHAHDKLAPLFMHAVDPLQCQANWMLVCENGAVGYIFDPEKRQYVEYYREAYPYSEDHRNSLFGHVTSKLEGKLGVSFINVVSLIFRPPMEGASREEVQKNSHEIALLVQQELAPYDPKGALTVADSGIGVTIFPRNSNKERGIAEFARFIAAKHGYKFSPEAKEIVAVGDRPEPMGNDEGFLNGLYGTPFTVGNTHPQNLLPLPVFDQSGKILTGPGATLFLLEQLRFRE